MLVNGSSLRLIHSKFTRLVLKMIKMTKSGMSRRPILTRTLFLAVFLYILYYFGVFTHFFERDLAELRGPIKVNFQLEIARVFSQEKPAIDSTVRQNVNREKLNYTFIHKAEHTCTKRMPFLVILIKSKVDHFANREAIRKTWAQLDEFDLIKRVFLVGLPDEQNEQDAEKVEIENKQYLDVVQQNFFDTYYNNTIKTFMGIKWVLEFCPQARYYLFIDDDFYLNPKLLISYLRNNITSEMYNTLYAGYVFPNASPMRHQISKWYISLNDYPYGKFPPYVAAGCYLLTPKSLRLFYMASKIFDIFKFDDIYMGILAFKLDIKPVNIDNIYYYAPTYYPSVYANEVMAAHQFAPDELIRIWTQLGHLVMLKADSYDVFFKTSI